MDKKLVLELPNHSVYYVKLDNVSYYIRRLYYAYTL